MSKGRKYDSEKPKLHLLPPKAVLEVGKVLTFGAEKYDPENWKKVPDLQNRYTSAALRHIFAHMDNEELDEETGLSHLAHAMCCLLFKLEIELEQKNKEERPRESSGLEYSSRYTVDVSNVSGGKTYNQKGSLRNSEYKLQYNSIDLNTGGLPGEGKVRSETEGPKPWKSRYRR